MSGCHEIIITVVVRSVCQSSCTSRHAEVALRLRDLAGIRFDDYIAYIIECIKVHKTNILNIGWLASIYALRGNMHKTLYIGLWTTLSRIRFPSLDTHHAQKIRKNK